MLERILQKSEKERNRWALGLSVSLSLLILVSFGFYKGYLSFGAPTTRSANQANAIYAKEAPSPVENSKKTFGKVFYEIDKQYQGFKEAVSAVLVPFVTGIEVYERK